MLVFGCADVIGVEIAACACSVVSVCEVCWLCLALETAGLMQRMNLCRAVDVEQDVLMCV